MSDGANSQPQQVNAGWYDDGNGNQRWHDGTKWTEKVQKPAKREKKRRVIPLWLGATGAAAALLIGMGIGGASGSAPSVASSVEYKQVVAENRSLTQDQQEVESQLEAKDDELAELQSQMAAVEARVTEVEAREAAVQAAEEALAAVPPPAAPEPVAPAPVAPAPEVPAPYYDNCTAAREAGGAPVYAGGPGYGRHLDRDGDGVGCE